MNGLAKFTAAVLLISSIGVSAQADEVLTKAEIEAEILGHEFRGRAGDGNTLWLDIGTDGTFYGTYRNASIRGKYRLTDDGQWCRRVNNGPEECQTVHRRDSRYVWIEKDGSPASDLERQ